MTAKDEFINPISPYHGKFTPENLAFDANLQEFAQRIGIICALENGGKLESIEAYEMIKALWSKLETSKRNLFDHRDD